MIDLNRATQSQTDQQLDEAAKLYAFKNAVSYGEALYSVVTLASCQEASFSELAMATGPAADDAKLHRKSVAYAAIHRVTFAEALKAIVESGTADIAPNNAASASTSGAVNHSSFSSDEQLDVAAKHYVQSHGGSYSEALNCVVSNGNAMFSEGSMATASVLERQPIEIFKAGIHTDTTGNQRSFSVADVQAMATCYSAARHEAPLTLGHPGDDKPAYGWVKALQATADGRLLMTAKQVDPAFAESVQLGRYKKRSASFYPPNAPVNPAPGQWYLRHVAWLGAQPPAIRGMADANFGDSANDLITFTFTS